MDEELIENDDSVFDGILNLDFSARSDALREDSFSSIVGESGAPRSRASFATPGTPAPLAVSTPIRPNQAQASRLKCPHCSNTYANKRTLGVHVRTHAMKNAFSLMSKSAEELKLYIASVIPDVLSVMSAEIVPVPDTKNLSTFIKVLLERTGNESNDFVVLLAKTFSDLFRNLNVLLPSGMKSSVYCSIANLLMNQTFRKTFKKSLSNWVPSSDDVVNVFMGVFVLKLTDKLLVFVFKKIRGSVQDPQQHQLQSKEIFSSDDFQQVAYHVAGSIIHGLIVKGRLHPDSPTWVSFVEVVKSKFLRQQETDNGCPTNITAFCAQKDRGGFVHCNQETFDFFFHVFQFVMGLEEEDGSILLSVVETKVCDNGTLILSWDELAGGALGEENSLELFLLICRASARVVSKGVMKRRLNEELKKAYAPVALRPRLAH